MMIGKGQRCISVVRLALSSNVFRILFHFLDEYRVSGVSVVEMAVLDVASCRGETRGAAFRRHL